MIKSNIRMLDIDLGVKKIQIPIWQQQEGNGPHILITAGMDGDEYAGIEAAFQIILSFQRSLESKRYNLTVIPIVNIPGFENGVSLNPLDNKYPKFTMPGKKNGSPTEILMSWIYVNYISRSLLWIDLHGGAVNEDLIPFLSFYTINNPLLSTIYRDLIRQFSSSEVVLYQKKQDWQLPKFLSKKNIGYFLSEAGQRGERDKISIKLHTDRVNKILKTIGVYIENPRLSTHALSRHRFQHISILTALKTGLWSPHIEVGVKFGKNQIMGTLSSYDQHIISNIKTNQEGMLLWRKNSMFVVKGEELGGYAAYD